MQEKIFDLSRSYSGRLGLYFEDLQSGQTVQVNSESVFRAASTIKVPLVALAFILAEEGQLALNQRVWIKDENRVGSSGVLRLLKSFDQPSLRDLMTLTIVLSDNTATNELIDLIGMDPLNAWLFDLGFQDTGLKRKMLDVEAQRAGRENTMSPKDAGLLLKKIAKRDLYSHQVSEAVENLMANKC